MTFEVEHWFVDRKVLHRPSHFLLVSAPVTDTSLVWVMDNLVGRYYLGKKRKPGNQLSLLLAFEDPTEAALYELMWS